MIILYLFSFLAGFVTILAPCIWPVLPIVLSSSIAGGRGHQRPLGITLGVMLSFTIFTLSVSYLVRVFNLDPNVLRIIAVLIIGALGVMMIVPSLSDRFEVIVSRLANLFGQNTTSKGSGFLPGFITGLSLGIVWSPCAGPILATIATLSATGKVTLEVVLVTVFYVIGVGIPLFAFAYGGQQFITRARGLNKYTGRIQQIFGVVMLLAAFAIYTQYDIVLQNKLLDAFPGLNSVLNGFEKNQAVTNELNLLKGKQSAPILDTSGLFNVNTPASEFTGVTKWLNTDTNLSLKALRGKVVLVDFWTYTCINCIRTLPHVTSWYDKYKDEGFVVIGVHTPEFQFEHDTNNVLSAIKMDNIHYPVAQDNNYAVWNTYSNEYWPAEYLIDANGNIRRTHFGEGEYDQTEMAIQALLKEAGKKISSSLSSMPDQTPTSSLSPETYLGTTRMQYYYPSGSVSQGTQNFTLSTSPSRDSFSLGGNWTMTPDTAVTGNNATLSYNFSANKVFLVLRPGIAGVNAKVKVFLDGQLVTDTAAGSDVSNGMVTIDSDRLYNLIDLKGHPGNHVLRLEFQHEGIQAFAFTFG